MFIGKSGSKDFDPVGFCEVCCHGWCCIGCVCLAVSLSHTHFACPWHTHTQRAPDWVPWFRESELKHGRAAMLAVVGIVVPEFVRIPGAQFSFDAVPRVIEAHDALPDSMMQIFLWISFLEAVSFPALANMNAFDRAPGSFSFDPLNLYPKDAAGQKKFQVNELKNGRLAMVAIGGYVMFYSL